ncbi:MAG: MFS transporter [Caldilineaceae bacterium]
MSLSKSSALTASAASNRRLAITFVYFAVFVALGLTSASLGPTLLGLAERTGSALGQIGFLFTARSLGLLLGSLLAGRVYDRMAGHSVLGVMLCGVAVLLALVPMTSILWVLTALLLIIGLCEGTIDVGTNTLLVWIHGEKVGPYMNGLHFFFGVGALLSPLVVVLAAQQSGAATAGESIQWAYWMLAILVTPAVLLVLWLPSPSAPHTAAGHVHAPVDKGLVFLLALIFFLYVGAEIGVAGWIHTYAVETGVATPTVAAYLTSLFWGALTVGRMLSIPLAMRVRPRTILLSDILGCIASIAVIIIWPTAAWAVWVGALGSGLAMASFFPTVLSFAERRMTLTGRVTSWFFVGSSTGGMTLPWVMGRIFESWGPRAMMSLVMTALLLSLAVYFVIVARTENQ